MKNHKTKAGDSGGYKMPKTTVKDISSDMKKANSSAKSK